MASIAEKVKQIIVEQLGVDEAQVDNNASFVDDLGADSLDIVELVMAFEEAFDIDIPDEDAEKIATVKDAVDYIEKSEEVARRCSSGVLLRVTQSRSHGSRLADFGGHRHGRDLASVSRRAKAGFRRLRHSMLRFSIAASPAK